MTTSRACQLVVAFWMSLQPLVASAAIEPVTKVEKQPLVSATERLIESLTYVGAPLSDADLAALQKAMKTENSTDCVLGIQKVLDQHCVAIVHINPESRVKIEEGPVKKELVQQGWRTFLVKVANEAGVTGQLVPESPNVAPVYQRGKARKQLWLGFHLHKGQSITTISMRLS